jgi:hypothetical protein
LKGCLQILANPSVRPCVWSKNPQKRGASPPWVEARSSQPWTGDLVRERLLEAERVNRGVPSVTPRDSVVDYAAAGAVQEDDAPPRRGAARQKEIDAEHRSILREARSTVCHRPEAFAGMCDQMEHIVLSDQFDADAQQRSDEALGWLTLPCADLGDEVARLATLRWLAGKCCPIESLIVLTCDRIARELGVVAEPVFRAPHKAQPDLVFGIGNIAQELGIQPAATKRKIDRGEIPVGEYFGRPCAHRDLLRPFCERHLDRRSDRPLAA